MRIRHIRNKIVLASLVVVLPLIIWNVIAQHTRFDEKRSEALAWQERAAANIADLFVTYDHGVVSLCQAVGADLWDEQGALRPDASAYLSRVNSKTSSVRHLSAANPRGAIVASDSPQLIGLDHSRNSAVSQVMNGADWALSDVFTSVVSRRRVFGIVTGIRTESDQLQGMVLALADEETLRQVLARGLKGTSHAIITDRMGVVALASEPIREDRRDWGDRWFVRRALRGRAAKVERLTMPDGHVVMGAGVPVPGVGWTAGVFTPREEVIGPIRNQAVERVMLVAALTGLVLGLALYLGNRLSRPILDLAGTVRAFGEGKLGVRADIRTNDEIEYLGDRFNEMADAQQTRDAELRDALDAQMRESRQVELLYHMAEGVVVTICLEDKLRVIAEALAELTQTKRCIILLRKGNSIVGTTGWGILHPEILEAFSLDMAQAGDFAKVVKDLTPVVVADAEKKEWSPRNLPHDARLLSALVIPIAHAGRFVGIAVLDNPGEYTTFSRECIEATRNLAELAAIAIENAQIFEREKHIAEVLQQGLLPPIPHDVGRLQLSTGYYPALEFAEVGGDFYDYMELPGGLIGIVIADISGKGLEAAVHMAMGKYTMRSFAYENPSPADVLTRTNTALTRSSKEWGFITMFFGVIDPETLVITYANAGHPPAVLVRSGGDVSCVPCPGQQPPLGILSDIVYVELSLRLGPGDVLIGYTDGLIEARADGEMFETDRLCQLASVHRHEEPEDLVNTIYSSARDFSEGRLSDDIAILIVKAR